jgi:hypothetical protein
VGPSADLDAVNIKLALEGTRTLAVQPVATPTELSKLLFPILVLSPSCFF